MFWSDKEMDSQPLAEKIRKHFLAQNAYSYRSNATIELDSSTSSCDLSASFEEEIRAKRTTHTENDTKLGGSSVKSMNLEVPISDADTSSMNRLFAGFDLNSGEAAGGSSMGETMLDDVLEPSLFEKLSPCKMVGLMRPSTVYEETSVLSFGSRSQSTVRKNNVQDPGIETSFAPADSLLPEEEQSGESLNDTRDSLAHTSARASGLHSFDADSLDVSAVPINKEQTDKINCVDAAPDDTLEDVEYERNASRYVLKPVRKSRKSHPTPSVDTSIDDVIVLDDDSSPDTSYETAKTHVKTEREHLDVSDTFTAQNIDIIENEIEEVENIVVEDSEPEDDNQDKLNSYTNISDQNNGTDVRQRTLDDVSSLLTDTSEYPLEVEDMPDVFNDTIERMEYMIEHGKRIAEAQKNNSTQTPQSKLSIKPSNNTPSSSFRTPVSAASQSHRHPLFEAGSSSVPKQLPSFHSTTARSMNTPPPCGQPTKSMLGPASGFKKPLPFKTAITPNAVAAARKLTPSSMSRIPKPKSASKLSAYDYVKSPIGAYISKTAPNPMRQNVKMGRDFLDSTYCATASKGLDFTLLSLADEQMLPKSCRLPMKMYICGSQQKMIDRRTELLPADEKLQKLIGECPAMLKVCRGQRDPDPSALLKDVAANTFVEFEITAGGIELLEVHNA